MIALLKPYRYILWDWNGTLFDDAWLCVSIMNRCLFRRDLPAITEEDYRRVFRFPVMEYYRDLGFDFSSESFDDAGTEFITAYNQRREECSLQPGATAILAAVKTEKKGQSVLSAYKMNTLVDLVSHYGLAQYFDRCLGLDDHYAHGKIELGKEWMRHYAPCDAREIVLIGDTVHDYEVTQAMGIGCLLVDSGHAERSNLEACGVPVLDSLCHLLNKGDN